ncbi:hypothetical protein T10_1628 [Trichinella papuae]|uniref:PiggyBac transposable element-derived protein domain-containing protein n=1 Tax=Trichinella papuae TaxID=268474 RepID=A0A0V1MWQ6_9BILA|nr:hypothetical protein T10_1628 [Trichinella papuae]
MDPHFTSYTILQYLLEHGLTAVGTDSAHRRDVPACLHKDTRRDLYSTLTVYVQNKKVTIISYVPRKNRNVFLMTSCHAKLKKDNHRDGERCAANEQWRFQCDDRRRIAIKTALNTKIEDGRQRPEDDGKFGKYILLSSSTGYTARATLTISNDESPYFHSSPLPHPVAVPEACRLARSEARSSPARLPLRRLLPPCP